MKTLKIILIGLFVLLVIGLINRAINGKQIDKRNAENYTTAKKEAEKQELDKTISNAGSGSRNDFLENLRKTEPKIKEAIITESDVLYISVSDDGTKRDGLANYYCQALEKANIKDVRVKVVQFGSTKSPKRDNAYGILLGESDCN